jgi:F0F1-type ATP synthase assembly protein I
MTTVNAELVAKARRIIVVQVGVSLVAAAGFLAQGPWEAVSALYGGLASVVLAMLSGRGFKRAHEHALSDPKKSMMILYIGAVQRFVAVLVLLALGLGGFKLDPLAVFIGFALAQTSYLMGVRGGSKPPRQPD